MSIKLIISDYDGVLLDLKEIHFEALNRALSSIDENYVISPEEHVKTFDGLSTKSKLKLLSEIKGFPSEKFDEINDLKQVFTIELLNDFNNLNYDIVNVITQLKNDGCLFYVASNAIRNTVEIGLEKLGILHLVDKIYSNQDVKNAKPNPEIYLKCMVDASVSPEETLIIEDSKHGREAGVKSGAHICGVDNSFDFTLDRIKSSINNSKPMHVKWAGKSDLTVLIPMAGAGSRFAKEGYQLPKPLIDVNGKPMIQHVIDNLNVDAEFVFVVQEEHYNKYNLGAYLNLMVPGCKVVQTNGLTEGAACTTLLAKDFINNSRHLLIANSDQFVEWDSCDFIYSMLCDNADGGILTFEANDPKWSYARLGDDGYVCEVVEKQVISNEATCLGYSTPVLLANGKTEIIGKIVNNKIDVEVLSFNQKTNKFEKKKILNYIKNDGNKSKWFRLTYKDAFKTRNGKNKSVLITGDHNILTENGYQRVDNINNEKILTKYLKPNEKQMEMIDGMLLGDGFYSKPNNKGEMGRLNIKQSLIQKKYALLKINSLNEFKCFIDIEYPGLKFSKNRKINSSGSIKARFSSNPFWSQQRDRWYKNNIKIVPEDLKLTPLLLATWYMDDGSLKSNKKDCILSTECFDEKSINVLIEKFKEIDIYPKPYRKNKGKALAFYGNNANKIFNLIKDFILPEMQYKLPKDYQNQYNENNWRLGSADIFTSEIKIEKLELPIKRELQDIKYSYCLEVEDNHNFIVNDMVVSNCGVYYWKHGSDYVRLAEQMISKNIRVANEFYVAPVYNEAFLENMRVKIHRCEKMWGLGIPSDLKYFLENKKVDC